MENTDRISLGGGLPEIAPAVPKEKLKAEVDALPATACLAENGRLRAFYASAQQIPSCVEEIGRLREITFRAVGEGTGKAVDLDRFDSYYLHLFVWDVDASAIVGAYRMGPTDEIQASRGASGLYTSTLFRYGPRLLERLTPAIELGRSFVRVEYQKSFSPLLLLWQGILRFVVRAPQYAIVFGPVSISNGYTPLSRQLLVEFLKKHKGDALSEHVEPRHAFSSERGAASYEVDIDSLSDLEEVSRVVSRVEPDRKGVPILIRHYLKLGGRILGFNVDDRFAEAIDALLLVDLRLSDPRVLARYMGKDGIEAFRAYHDARLRKAS